MKKKQYSLREIAGALGRAVSALSYELRRNRVKGSYDPKKAQHKAYVRRRKAKFQAKKIVEHRALRKFVERALLAGRSPASIAGRITHHEKHLPSISADSIERFLKSVYGRRIEAHRKRLQEKQKRHTRRPKVRQLKDRKFIDVRPRIIDARSRVGDTEADFIESGRNGNGRLLVVVDRKLRMVFIEKIFPVRVKNITNAFMKIKTRYPELWTITTDNDILLAHHQQLERLLGVPIYFCHPYHSWEKGSIENANGVIRVYIPKGSDIAKYSWQFIRSAETKVNDRYMECLRFATPREALATYRKRKNRAGTRRGCEKRRCSI